MRGFGSTISIRFRFHAFDASEVQSKGASSLVSSSMSDCWFYRPRKPAQQWQQNAITCYDTTHEIFILNFARELFRRSTRLVAQHACTTCRWNVTTPDIPTELIQKHHVERVLCMAWYQLPSIQSHTWQWHRTALAKVKHAKPLGGFVWNFWEVA